MADSYKCDKCEVLFPDPLKECERCGDHVCEECRTPGFMILCYGCDDDSSEYLVDND